MLTVAHAACVFALCAEAPTIPPPGSCGADSGATTLAEADVQTRLLTERITTEAARAREWRYVWAAINGLSTVVPLAVIPLAPPDIRPDLLAGSISSAVSTGFTLFWPLEIESAPLQLASVSGLAPCQRLQAVRAVAAAAADDEIARRAWPWHVINFGISAALGAVVAFGFHHPTGGLVTGLSGFAAGEAQLFTQPVTLSRDPLLTMSASRMRPLWWASPTGNAVLLGAVLEGPLP